MPSPFPGLDPFLEGQIWRDFHQSFIVELRTTIAPRVVPRYIVRVEEYIYLEYAPEEWHRLRAPDVCVVEQRGALPPAAGASSTVTLPEAQAVTLTLPEPRYRHEVYLTIRDRESLEVITAIEFLSPTNKDIASGGRGRYLEKRDEIIQSSAHLIELDLLRGGERLPMVEPLPQGDYYAFISRAPERPKVTVYSWPLRDPMPTIPVPLAGDDPDVELSLQSVFTTVYDRALYRYSLNYRQPVKPPLSESDAAWVREQLQARTELSVTEAKVQPP
jgi:hypothetical protein